MELKVNGDKFKRGDRLHPEVINIVCIGDLDNQKNIVKAIIKLDNVKLNLLDGVPRNLSEIYKESDIFAIAEYEKMDYQYIAEAMAASLPIICSCKTQTFQDFVEDGALIVQDNPAAFKKAFEELIEHPELRLELGVRNRLHAVEFIC